MGGGGGGVKGVSNDAQILQIVPTPLDPIQTKQVNSKFGEVPYGSVLYTNKGSIPILLTSVFQMPYLLSFRYQCSRMIII